MQMRRFSPSTYALFISLLFHALLFLISLPRFVSYVSDTSSVTVQVPVSLSIVAPPMSPSIAHPLSMPSVTESHQKSTPSPKASSTGPSTPAAKPSAGSSDGKSDTSSPGLPGDRPSAGTASPILSVYPKSALNNEWTGSIVAEFMVDESGHVLSYRVLKSTGHDLLDQAFVRSVQATRFEPKRVMGKAVRDTVKLSYEFKLQ